MEQRPCLVQQVFHADVWGQDILCRYSFLYGFFPHKSLAFFRRTASFFFLAPSFFYDAVE